MHFSKIKVYTNSKLVSVILSIKITVSNTNQVIIHKSWMIVIVNNVLLQDVFPL